jgi:hypothetical protein
LEWSARLAVDLPRYLEFPATGCGVDVFSEALKADVSTVHIGDLLNEDFEGSAQAI